MVCEGVHSGGARLPVEDLVELLVGDLEGDVVGREGLFFEVVRQPVVLTGEAGGGIEGALLGEHRFAQGRDVIGAQLQAGEAVDDVQKRLEGFGLVEDRKGDEQAHAGCATTRSGPRA